MSKPSKMLLNLIRLLVVVQIGVAAFAGLKVLMRLRALRWIGAGAVDDFALNPFLIAATA